MKTYFIFCCLIAACGGLLFGFDTAVISGTTFSLEAYFHLTSTQMGFIVSSALVGSILGAAISGLLSERFGRKKALIISGLLFLASSIFCGIINSIWGLIWARAIGGVGLGIAAMVSPQYIAEISPPHKRGTMVSLYQFAITLGILLAYFSNGAVSHFSSLFSLLNENHIWRPMFMMESVPSLIFTVLACFIPESPRWFYEKKQFTKAKEIFHKILTPPQVDREWQSLEFQPSNTSKESIFLPKYRSALFLGLFLCIFCQLSGINAIIYFGPKIFQNAGISFNSALGHQILLGIINCIFTIITIAKIDTVGRKQLLFWGTTGMLVSHVGLGYLFSNPNPSGLHLIFFLGAFLASFSFSLGPITWVIVSEIFPTKIRSKAMSFCTLVHFLYTGIVSALFPLMLEYLGTSLSFFNFAVFLIPVWIFTLKYMPETKGKLLEGELNA